MRRIIEYWGGLDEAHEYNLDDTISSCKYSAEGANLAIGDDSGRVIIFDVDPKGQLQYSFQFKAHRGGHDWANKEDLKPSVVSLEWLPRNGSSMGLVSAGAKSIKFWRVLETSSKKLIKGSGKIPSVVHEDLAAYSAYQVQHQQQISKELPSLHFTFVKNINLSANKQYLLSTDGKTLLKWNTENSKFPQLVAEAPVKSERIESSGEESMEIEPGNEADKQSQMEEEELVDQWNDLSYITNCRFHGAADNRLACSTKHGSINYFDMRCTNSTRPSLVLETPKPNQFLKRFLDVISDFAFLPNGYEVVSRDFLSVKVWDMRKASVVNKISVFPSINYRLKDLFEEMHHKDSFPLVLSPDGRKVSTGFFDRSFHEIDVANNTNVRYPISDKNQCKPEQVKQMQRLDVFDADPKVNCIDYNPRNELCATVRDSLFLFKADAMSEEF